MTSDIGTANTIRFPSLATLKEAHGELLQRRRTEGESPALLDAIAAFISRAQATGALLDDVGTRDTVQSRLIYWDNLLYRAGRMPPESTLADFDPRLAPELPDSLCPYLGLDAFRENDSDKFFGRRELINRLIERSNTHRLIAVVGPSGSGKSSVVRAGLIPALKGGALPGSREWRYLPPIVPGSDPLASLERGLRTESQEPRTQEDNSVLGSPIVLVVDQFEELFTLCNDEAARREFANRLLALTKTPVAQHRLILTMRSDFETFIAQLPQLQALFEAGRVQVTPLSAAELREAIERPAEAVGLKFEAGVVDLLLQGILGEPAGLPLLQFTLLKLWEQRDRNRITRTAYDQVGGGRLALARSADAFYSQLIPEEQVTARRILLRMVRPGEGLEITSSRIRRPDLYRGGEDPTRVNQVLVKLVDAHLVRLTEGETPGDAQVEVAHEALVRNWPTLVDWLEQEKAALAVRRRLDGRAAEWVRLGRGAGGLLDQIELQEAEHWLQSAEAAYLGYDPALPELVRASAAAIEQRTRRSTRLRIALVVISLTAAVLGVGLAIFAFQQRQAALNSATAAQRNAHSAGTAEAQAQEEAVLARTAEAQTQTQKQIVESQQLAFAADSQIDSAPETALLLAYEAAARDDNGISQQALRDDINHVAWVPTILSGHISRVNIAVFSPDGQSILTASGDATARLWDLNGKSLTTLIGHSGKVWSAVFSPDGQRILTASSDATTRLWDATGMPLAALIGHTEEVSSASFSPDGRRIVTASVDGTARLWDVNGKQLSILKGHIAWVRTAIFSPDGQHILTASDDQTARLWDVNGKQLSILKGHTAAVRTAIFRPDGQYILTASVDKTARLWDLQGNLLATLAGHTDTVNSVVFSPDGQHILTASVDKTVRLWDLGGSPLAILSSHTDAVNTAVFSPNGQRILTASFDQTARLWDASGRPLAAFRDHTRPLKGAVFSPDSSLILTASLDQTARQYLVNISDLLKVAACRVGRGLSAEEIARFQVPTPLKFDFAKRQCPPALEN